MKTDKDLYLKYDAKPFSHQAPETMEEYLSVYLECLTNLVSGLCDVNGDNLKYKQVKADLEVPRLEELKSLISSHFDKNERADLLDELDKYNNNY